MHRCTLILFVSTSFAWHMQQHLSALDRYRIGQPCTKYRRKSASLVYLAARLPTTRWTLDDGASVDVVSRTVPISPDWNVTIWELDKLASVVESYWDNSDRDQEPRLDPFGLVCWPGSVIAAQELHDHVHVVQNKCVLVLGAGVGIEALAAAQLGAKSVLATDIHPLTLKLLNRGAEMMGLSDIVSTSIFDINSSDELPPCDLIVIADVLYNDELAGQVARRCLQAHSMAPVPPVLLISDSQRFVKDFERDVSTKMLSVGRAPVAWRNRTLPAFSGSGVAIDEDQTYEVRARIMWIGLWSKSN